MTVNEIETTYEDMEEFEFDSSEEFDMGQVEELDEEARLAEAEYDKLVQAANSPTDYANEDFTLRLLGLEIGRPEHIDLEASVKLHSLHVAGERERLNGSDPEIIAKGENAKETLLKSVMPMSIGLARMRRGNGVPVPDLFQAGMIGALEALDMYDPGRGCKFITYAAWRIRAMMNREIQNSSRTIRIPESRAKSVNAVLKSPAILQAIQENQRLDLTPGEISEALEMNQQKVEMALHCIGISESPSLDAPTSEEKDDLAEFIHDNVQNVEEACNQRFLRETIGNALDELTPRERFVLAKSYGLDGEGEYTLTEIGRMINRNRETARLSEASALRRLRHPSRARKLRGFA